MKDVFINTLPRIIDLSCVKQNHTIKDIDRMIALAKQYHFICTFALPSFTPYLIEKIKKDSDILVGGTVGFPSGCDTTESKVYQAKELLHMGCDEFDMVINVARLKSDDLKYVFRDIKAVVDAVGKKPVKTILEVTLLTEEEIVKACKIAIEAGATYIKTGTGWCPEPTTVEHIKLIKATVKNEAKIKAAGGIRNLSTIKDMLEAGCDRFGIGTSSALSVLQEADNI